jgi:ABC-type iron transport system FetAB permease component
MHRLAEKANKEVMTMNTETLDREIQISEDQSPTDTRGAERAMMFALAFSGIRCTLQYVVLPFVLPVLGITGDVAPQIFLVINIIAILAVSSSIRRMWRTNYKYKWQYLVIGSAAMVILTAFTIMDLQASGGV